MIDKLKSRLLQWSSLVALLIALAAALSGAPATHAAALSSQPEGVKPYIAECQYTTAHYRPYSSNSGGNYTIYVRAVVYTDNYFSHGVCDARADGYIYGGPNTIGGTLNVYVYDNASHLLGSTSQSYNGGGAGGTTQPPVSTGPISYGGTCLEAQATWLANPSGYYLTVDQGANGTVCWPTTPGWQ